MTQPAIQVDGIGKQYQLGLRERASQTLREAVVDLARAPLRRLRHLAGRMEGDGTFWALRDICFDVPEGEVLGIIGHNGAGKSTLLKILSRITEPTEGRAVIHGRVASLLEVGTGFHQELSGRENVYLNGAILGMSKREIDRKFDEIVEFSGVEKFLDTPIKRYSSGMKVRLAFAVAAHLDPEILIIDEVLAVGDAEFQKKCLGKMEDVAGAGRTVLFVSHNMAAIEFLCDSGLLLETGRIAIGGPIDTVVHEYLQRTAEQAQLGRYIRPTKPAGFCVTLAEARSADGFRPEGYPLGTELIFDVHCSADSPVRSPSVGIGIDNEKGQRLVTLHSAVDESADLDRTLCGTFLFSCSVSALMLAPGRYTVKIVLDTALERAEILSPAFTFEILKRDIYGITSRNFAGIVFCSQKWTVMPMQSIDGASAILPSAST